MQNAVYFVLGSWCLCASVLVCAYNSLLVSYILGSNTAEPIVDSLRELAQNSKINLAVDKGYSADVYVSVIHIKSLVFEIFT
jgi:ionotropic glutamate receptor